MRFLSNEFLDQHWQRLRDRHTARIPAVSGASTVLQPAWVQTALTGLAITQAVLMVVVMLWLSDQWYQALALPQWAMPQAWLMSAWTVLAMFSAIAVLAVHRLDLESPVELNRPLLLVNVQLLLGLAWLGLFYGLHALGSGFALACLLWLLTLATVAAFMNLRPLAAWLLVPQMLWFSYLLILNGVLWLTAASPSLSFD